MECLICGLEINDHQTSVLDRTIHIECPRCGSYSVTQIAAAQLNGLTIEERANISGYLFENPKTEITTINIDYLRNLKSPKLWDKADKLLLNILKQIPSIGQTIQFHISNHNLSKAWAKDRDELEYILISFLIKQKRYLEIISSDNYKITPEGWEYIESLYSSNPNSNISFVAMWFDESLDQLYLNYINPAISDAGYEALRIDMHQHNNKIDDEIVAMIKRSKFLIADFTGQRGGVYFEAGFAMGLGLPVIWLCKEEELKDVHFDTRQYNFILWNENDLDKLKNDLRFRIERTIGRGKNN